MTVMVMAESKVKIDTFSIDSSRAVDVDGCVNRMQDSTVIRKIVLPVMHNPYGMFPHTRGIVQVPPLFQFHSHLHNTIINHRLRSLCHRCYMCMLRTRMW